MKVLNKAKVLELLNDGNQIMYDTIYSKVYVVDKDINILGSVQFNTYIKMCGNEIVKSSYSYYRNFYSLNK
jgi:hypothetical protein